MEQSTDISLLSALNQLNNSKDTSCVKEPIKRHLTLYSKQIRIENKFTGEDLYYEPNTAPLSENYIFEENLYECVVAPTRVYIAKERNTGRQVAIKEITKLKIKSKEMLEFVYNEVAITKYLSLFLNSIVQVFDYYENDNTINLVMELCDRPNFFEELLENVRIYNIEILRDIVRLKMKKHLKLWHLISLLL
jgi:hypothetical protein